MLKNQLEVLEKAFEFFSKEKFNGLLTDKNTVITIQSKGKLKCYAWCTTQPAWYKNKETTGEGEKDGEIKVLTNNETSIVKTNQKTNDNDENSNESTNETTNNIDSSIDKDEKLEVYHEINFSAEYFNRNIYNTMETLLHEMVHLYNIFNDIVDCNKKQFHNEEFKKGAERIGLIVDKIKTFGWANTYLSKELRVIIDEFIIHNNIDMNLFDIARNDEEIKKVARNNKKIKMICPQCGCVVTCENEANILCKDCDQLFILK